MPQATRFHNTTGLTGHELSKKDAACRKQEDRLLWLMQHLKESHTWWTRDALNRVHVQYFGFRLKDQSISRGISNLSAMLCPACKKYHTHRVTCGIPMSACPRCGNTTKPLAAPLTKSEFAEFRSDEGDRVYAWKLTPVNPGQGDLFPGATIKEGMQD